MNTLELDIKLNAMIVAGKSVEALQTMYAEDVVAQEKVEGRQGCAGAVLPQVAGRAGARQADA